MVYKVYKQQNKNKVYSKEKSSSFSRLFQLNRKSVVMKYLMLFALATVAFFFVEDVTAVRTVWNVLPAQQKAINVCGSQLRACIDCEFECPSAEGRFPGPDCQSYYRCRNKRPCVVQCARTTMYDGRTKTCLLRAFAQCPVNSLATGVTQPSLPSRT